MENNKYINKGRITNALSFSLIIPVIYGFLQFNGIDFFNWNLSDRSGRGEIFSSFGNVNWLANYLAISFPLILSGLFGQKKWIKNSTGIILFFSIILLFLTRSRGAILGLVLGFTLFIFITNKISLKKKMIIGIVFCLLFTSIELYLFNKGNYTLTKRLLKSNGITDRVFIWNVSLPLILKSLPFGAGPGNFSYLYPNELKKSLEFDDEFSKKHSVHANQTHNDPLQIVIELGPLGLFAFFLLSFKSFYTGFKSKVLSIQLSAVSILIFIFISFFGFPFSQPASLFLLFIAGLFVFSQSEYGIFKPNLWHPSIWFIFTLFVLIFFVKGILMISFSSIYLNQAKKYMKENNISQIIDNLEKSVEYFNGNGETSYLLGSYYLKENKNNEALKLLQTSSEHMVEPGIYYNMGIALSNLKKYDNAYKYFNKTAELSPYSSDYPRSIGEMGRIRILRGEIDQGAAMIFNAYQMDQTINFAIPEIMEYLNRRDKTTLAIGFGENYLANTKNIPVNIETSIIAQLSTLFLKLGMIEKSTELYINLDNICEKNEFINLKYEILLDEIIKKNNFSIDLLLLLESKLKYYIVKNLLIK